MGISPPIFPHYLLPAMFKFKNSFFASDHLPNQIILSEKRFLIFTLFEIELCQRNTAIFPYQGSADGFRLVTDKSMASSSESDIKTRSGVTLEISPFGNMI